jgi:hypothetical protein
MIQCCASYKIVDCSAVSGMCFFLNAISHGISSAEKTFSPVGIWEHMNLKSRNRKNVEIKKSDMWEGVFFVLHTGSLVYHVLRENFNHKVGQQI